MSEQVVVRLTDICTHLERLVDEVQPLAVQLELEYLIGRLERLLADTRGLEPPRQEDTP